MWRQLHLRLRSLFRRHGQESELDEEIRFHLANETEELMAAGMSPKEARAAAQRDFGNVTLIRELTREAWGWAPAERFLHDIRSAIRGVQKAKGWALVVLASLALGIGANTALFSAVDGLLFRTIPVPDPDGLVRLRWTGDNGARHVGISYGYTRGDGVQGYFSYPVFEALRDANETLSGLFAVAQTPLTLIVDGRAEVATGFAATGGYFGVLGLRPAAGRAIGPDDDRPGAEPVAMISHRFRQRRFDADEEAVGKVIRVNDVPTTIVGVLPPGYTGIRRPDAAAADVHLPLATLPLPERDDRLADGTTWWLPIMGRLKPGATAAQVQGNLDGVLRAAAQSALASHLDGLSEEERALPRNRDLSAEPRLLVDSGRQGLYDANPRSSGQALVLGVVVALVLLIVCANVATLLLSRAVSRHREVAIRMSVGASRGRLIRQLVTESLFLSATGGALALPVAWAARGLLPFGQTSPFDWRVFAFAAMLSLAAGMMFSLVPALRATRAEPLDALKEQSRSVTLSRSRLSRALIVVQVALSLALLVGAGLFLKTLANLRGVDVGFNPEQVLLFQMDSARSGYGPEESVALYARVRDSVQRLPGVRSVTMAQQALLAGGRSRGTVHVEGGTDPGRATHMMTVAPGFFDTMEISLLAGRAFEARDDADAPRVAVINAAAATELFGVENAVGRRFGFDQEERGEIEVVGVARDNRYDDLRGAVPPTVFRSAVQSPLRAATFAVRTGGPPNALTPAVREAVRQIDPRLPIMNVTTQTAAIEQRLSDERLYALAYTAFGGLATLLAAIGLFGLASYTVTQRTNEVGIRMALGAPSTGIAWMVLRESLVLVAAGVAAGVGMVLLAGRLIASLIHGLAPTDPITIVQAAALLAGIAAAAVWFPARRAARVDPLTALHKE
ncbi:MAG: ABC transporter permease [Acidobacteria bacterium]|nr:ABC transporter permease [Acidobacteriota bacterium]